ncbi:uncharacterized protein C8Q71DRAFT_744392 [Rhodofomes roseus]|uniref:Translation machinery-associated protein 16 n=1 Tax=Rhodofomes roseus TaxID=34475 RepID=A0A4Y9Z3U0_9APHY|nr:uncharacterized protein C8Q71DRAFT_744392 [Rhodofomes roseus]KAH9839831.1 hypothetical protein C8Q71DRAFT_744392 [Rhodofomes roseus]TFY68511.1 hypothetical protein EVJ58_g959 [Rhodofomes roseus]
MTPPKPGKKATTQKREKLFHPQSRKAEQLMRVQQRKSKLADLAKARVDKQKTQADIFSFFYHALPAEDVLSLETLHVIVRDVWLKRFDEDLEEEKKSRRKGRPKSTREQKLEELISQEAELYRTGMDVLDLTNPPNVELFRMWDQKEVAYIKQLRFIRISSEKPDCVVVSKAGKHPFLVRIIDRPVGPQDEQMDTDEAPLLMEPPSRFASTIVSMDGPA